MQEPKSKNVPYECNKRPTGRLYIFFNPSYPDWIKVGYSSNVYKRLKQHNHFTPLQNVICLAYTNIFQEAEAIERLLHNHLIQKKECKHIDKSEWYAIEHLEYIKSKFIEAETKLIFSN